MRSFPSVVVVTLGVGLTACSASAEGSSSATGTPTSATGTVGTGSDTVRPMDPAPSEPARSDAEFVETFDGNVGLDRFDYGIYHRDEALVAQTAWSGDHDLNCGPPETQRSIHRDVVDESFYVCRDHLMTSIGDTAGYSIGWFSPEQTFVHATEVSWDVNVTDLGARQWWEVSVVPSSFDAEVDECPQCSVVDWLSPDPSGLPAYPTGAVSVGNGPFGNEFSVHANGETFNPAEWQKVCGDEWALAGEACASKMDRLPFSLRDNRDGTLTLAAFGDTYTFEGSFPEDGFNVVFKDHNYTPDKDGEPVGHTWHWDNIVIR